MQKELPKSIRIGPFDYAVVAAKELLDGLDSFGKVQDTQQRILLDDSCTLQRQQETLLHEVIHAIFCTFQPPEGAQRREDQERDTKLLAAGLLQAIQDSPDFWTFLAPPSMTRWSREPHGADGETVRGQAWEGNLPPSISGNHVQ